MGLEERFLKMQFSGKARLGVYRKLITFLKNDVPITTALDTIYNYASQEGKKKKDPTAMAVDSWRKQIANGKSLGVAVAGWVPDNDRIVIEAGSGNLPQALASACLLHESQKEIKTALIGGLAYPCILVMIAFAFLIVFGLQVIPQFELILPKEEWTGLGAQMGMMSDFVRSFMIPLIVLLFVMICVLIWSMPRWTGPTRVRMERWPPFSIYRLVAGSGFLLSMAALIRSGVKTTSALEMLRRDSTPWYDERMSKTLAHVKNGNSLGDALHKTRLHFPDPETVNDLRSFSKLDGFDEMLMKIGQENLHDTVNRIKGQTQIMRNGGIVLMGGVFIWIYLGLFSLQQQITSHL